MNKVRVMLIGAAFSADLHAEAYARLRDKAKITAIVDKDLSRVEALASRYGFTGYQAFDNYETALEEAECDLVDICLPNFLHHDAAMAAMRPAAPPPIIASCKLCPSRILTFGLFWGIEYESRDK